MINVTERIAELMKLKGWTRYELSNQTGLSSNAVYDWFNKGATPTLFNISRICTAMQISLSYFFCGEDKEYSKEENAVLAKWVALDDFEKGKINDLIEAFKVAKSRS